MSTPPPPIMRFLEKVDAAHKVFRSVLGAAIPDQVSPKERLPSRTMVSGSTNLRETIAFSPKRCSEWIFRARQVRSSWITTNAYGPQGHRGFTEDSSPRSRDLSS